MLGIPKNVHAFLINKNKEAKYCAIYQPKFKRAQKQESKQRNRKHPNNTNWRFPYLHYQLCIQHLTNFLLISFDHEQLPIILDIFSPSRPTGQFWHMQLFMRKNQLYISEKHERLHRHTGYGEG